MPHHKSNGYINKLSIPTDGTFELKNIDANNTFNLDEKKQAKETLEHLQTKLMELQNILYAQARHAVLIILQAIDTGGKDGTIRHVFGPLNPQGVRVTSFKAPTSVELAHDYLWRIHKEVPPKGMIHIFNRSHYEEVLIARVHQLAPENEIEKRYNQINAFENYLTENGVTIIKFFLYISKDEQKRRLQSRLDRPEKNWKFNKDDLTERALWDDYMKAFNFVLNRCSKKHAPWYLIPANHKWARDVFVADIVLQILKNLNLEYPQSEGGLKNIVIPD
jgi:PPK2 family polyphosphate:nucleotide phosphotransferase